MSNSSSSEPVPDGTGLLLKTCDAKNKFQNWTKDGSDIFIASSSPRSCIDCNGCTSGMAVHLWHCSSDFASNQEWIYDISTKLLRNKAQNKFCLSAKDLQMAACDERNQALLWTFLHGGLLQSLQTSKCLTAAYEPDGEANFTTTDSGTYFFFLDFGRGFGGGFNGYVTLTADNITVQSWVGLTNMPDSLT